MEDHRSPLTIEQKPENTEQLVMYGQLYPELLILYTSFDRGFKSNG
jgi:hypothetical protein